MSSTQLKVPANVQIATLDRVVQRVAETASRRLAPVVEIDLDLTALRPRERTRRALCAAGKAFGVSKLAYDETAAIVLPGYTAAAWTAFVDASGLREQHPQLDWGSDRSRGKRTIYSIFHDHYWTTKWLSEDEPTAGLGEFVRRVEDHGGLVVFLSGRWRVEQIPLSRAALQRAGIPKPLLLIGNPRHENNTLPGESGWSDAHVKAVAQEEIRAIYGIPVAVFDDRQANRDAVVAANADFLKSAGIPPILSVGIAVPGFTHDAATDEVPLRVSSFESFALAGPDPRREPYLAARYRFRDAGAAYRGSLCGLGRNGRGYVLPRMANGETDARSLPSGIDRPFKSIARLAPGSLTEEAFMEAVESTIPSDVQRQLKEALEQAESQAKTGLAAPFPDQTHRIGLWHSLACSWLHSRDMEALMASIGYPLPAKGIHDLEEYVPNEDILEAITRSLDQGNQYSEWFLRWLSRLDRRGAVNVGFLNPNLTVSNWQWREGVAMPQDAMDAHRVSSHHQGDGDGRYDPVEATINNLLHAREGIYGIQSTPTVSFVALERSLQTQVGAEALAKSSWGGSLLKDAVSILRLLEDEGYVMPWGVVKSPPPGDGISSLGR